MKKRILFIILSVFILFFFTGCSVEQYSEVVVDEIERVEIVSAENSLEYTVIKKLSEVEEDMFIEQLLNVKFYQSYGDPPELSGDCIKITYNNGVFEMLCDNTMEYVENGRAHLLFKACDEEVFNNLYNSFLKENTK